MITVQAPQSPVAGDLKAGETQLLLEEVGERHRRHKVAFAVKLPPLAVDTDLDGG